MPLDLQVKLLRVLETGTFMRVGSTQVQETDVRIIAATNRNPLQAVASGKLREDLLYRLNVFPIHLPPLRERAEDMPLIAEHFLDADRRARGRDEALRAGGAASGCAAHRWPGNVRELRNVVYRAYVMTPGATPSSTTACRGGRRRPPATPARRRSPSASARRSPRSSGS